MPTHPLYVNIVWHMHQPYYKDVATGRYIMPWVGLHATKDYLDMPMLVGEFEGMRATFNMVPSLLEQIEDYAEGTAIDNYNELAVKRPEDLSEDERVRLVRQFFSCQFDRMIRPHARYLQLAELKGWAASPADLQMAARRFTESDLRDLQVWFYLAWIDPILVEADPRLQALIEKQRNFSESDKLELLGIVKEIAGRITPEMKKLWDAGKIEISTTPYYHPILPLLVDTQIARRARPTIPLPYMRFQHPEDAQRQIEMGLDYFERVFGRRPNGMWPSEGSVCPELIPMFREAGVSWIATDEGVLSHSIGEQFWRERGGRVNNMDALYRPWLAEHNGDMVHMFFRDRYLSDLPGFKYANWPAGDAAADMVRRLEEIHYFLKGHSDPHVVSIILDGENCWEHFEQDGAPFLRALYGALSTHRDLKPVTPSEYLGIVKEHQTLKKLHSGSWINEDFSIWIGHQEDNASWDLLSQARADLVSFLERPEADEIDDEAKARAWKSIHVAEGSDWNWWYGDDHSSGIDDQFDMLYRRHLTNVYDAIGLAPPAKLQLPIAAGSGDPALDIKPAAFIQPTVDGRISGFYEWFAAGRYNAAQAGDSMHQAVHYCQFMYFGFDRENFYLRLDFDESFTDPDKSGAVSIAIHLFGNLNHRVDCDLDLTSKSVKARILQEISHGDWREASVIEEAAFDRIFEIAIPLAKFNPENEDVVRIQAALIADKRELERCPSRSPLTVSIPDERFEDLMWNV